MSIASLFRLRAREPQLARPYRAPFYPLLPGFALAIAAVALAAMIWFNVEIFVIFAVLMLVAVSVARLRGGQGAATVPAA